MTTARTALCFAMLLSLPTFAAAKPMSDKARLRAEAEHACYNDAQTLCPDAIPDEDKVTACMTAKRARLSPACGKIFDRGTRS